MFINTLPILFSFTSLISPFELLLILLAILLAIYRITPAPDHCAITYPYSNFYLFLHAAWLGKASLQWVFWPFFILVNLAFCYFDYRAEMITYTISSWKTAHGMIIIPIAWWTVAVWRCSKHANRQWASLARTLTLYLIIELLLRFILSTYFPQLLFDCRQISLEYGDC